MAQTYERALICEWKRGQVNQMLATNPIFENNADAVWRIAQRMKNTFPDARFSAQEALGGDSPLFLELHNRWCIVSHCGLTFHIAEIRLSLLQARTRRLARGRKQAVIHCRNVFFSIARAISLSDCVGFCSFLETGGRCPKRRLWGECLHDQVPRNWALFISVRLWVR